MVPDATTTTSGSLGHEWTRSPRTDLPPKHEEPVRLDTGLEDTPWTLQARTMTELLRARTRLVASIFVAATLFLGVAVAPFDDSSPPALVFGLHAAVIVLAALTWRTAQTAEPRWVIAALIGLVIASAIATTIVAAGDGRPWIVVTSLFMTATAVATLVPLPVGGIQVLATVLAGIGILAVADQAPARDVWLAFGIGVIGVALLSRLAREQEADRRWTWETVDFFRDNLERFRQAADHINGVLWLAELGPSGERWLYVSQRYEQLWGLKRRALRARPRAWLDRVHPEDRSRVEASFAADAPAGRYVCAYRLVDPDGRTRFVRDAVFPIRGSQGRRERRARISIEATVEHELERAERLNLVARSVQTSREEEQRRIARELHDELGQALTGIKLTLGGLMPSIDRDAAAVEAVETAIAEVDTALASVSGLISRLRPPALDDAGLNEAIRSCAEAFTGRTGVRCELDLPRAEIELPDEQRTTLFRVAQEALTNVARHAEASRVSIALQEGTRVCLTVADDGRGPGAAEPGWGIRGMCERAALVGGTCEVEAGSNGGTVVRLAIPRSAIGVES